MNEEPFPDESKNRRDGGSEAATSLQPTHQRVRLPPELIDMIIAELCTDRAALASCALVCKSWVPASRKNLFLHITIASGNYFNSSQIPSSAIALAIKHLTLVGKMHFEDLHELLGRLSSVTQLTLSDSSVLGANTFSLPAWISLIQNLETLELEDVRIATTGTLRLLLTHSRRLKSLILQKVLVIDSLSDHVLQPLGVDQDISMPELKFLVVGESCKLLSWLVSYLRNAAPQLTTFTLEVGTWASFLQEHLMESVLEVIGMRLRDFRFSVILEDTPQALQSLACFRCLRQLESFSFQPYALWGVNPNIPMEFVLHALRHLDRRHLQELTIVLVSAEHNLLDHNIWSELGSILESLPLLRALTFRVIRDPFAPVTAEAAAATEPWISELLPLCAARGIIRFVKRGSTPPR